MDNPRPTATAPKPGRSWHELDQALDSICGRFEAAIVVPTTLYHYTDWAGVKGILESREIRATSHDCTNDPNELKTADAVIHEIAGVLQEQREGTAALAVRLLMEHYDEQPVSKFVPNYLTCFSEARDHENQWRMYGKEGCGWCLGLRQPQDGEPPHSSDFARVILPVTYSQDAVRERIRQAFTDVIDLLASHYPQFDGDREPFVYAVTALYRIAGVTNVTTKTQAWANEHEWRLVVVPARSVKIEQVERVSPTGKRYLSVPLRSPGKVVALDEITIGPARDAEKSRDALLRLLQRLGYTPDMPEWPQIRQSEHAVSGAWKSSSECEDAVIETP